MLKETTKLNVNSNKTLLDYFIINVKDFAEIWWNRIDKMIWLNFYGFKLSWNVFQAFSSIDEILSYLINKKIDAHTKQSRKILSSSLNEFSKKIKLFSCWIRY